MRRCVPVDEPRNALVTGAGILQGAVILDRKVICSRCSGSPAYRGPPWRQSDKVLARYRRYATEAFVNELLPVRVSVPFPSTFKPPPLPEMLPPNVMLPPPLVVVNDSKAVMLNGWLMVSRLVELFVMLCRSARTAASTFALVVAIADDVGRRVANSNVIPAMSQAGGQVIVQNSGHLIR